MAFSARLPAYDRYNNVRMLTDMPKLLDLSIGLTGRDSLRLNGVSIIDAPTLYADEGGKRKKKRIYPWVLGGIGVVLVATSITFLAE